MESDGGEEDQGQEDGVAVCVVDAV